MEKYQNPIDGFTGKPVEPPNLINVSPIKDWIIVDIVDKGFGLTAAGIIVLDDDFKEAGIRPRWAKVLASGPKARQSEIWPGGWVLVAHAEWTRGFGEMTDINGNSVKAWGTQVDKVLGYDDTKPSTMAKKVSAFVAS